jgi:superfamily II DNA or RNA helicase
MAIRVEVDNRIRVELARLPDEVRASICEGFQHRNPQFFLNRALGFPTWKTPAVIKTWGEVEGRGSRWLSLPRGGMQRVRAALVEAGLEREVVDMRESGNGDSRVPDHNVSLRTYQAEAVAACIARENCILKAPTGCGKTTVLFAIAARLKVPTLVLVPNSKLLKQWVKRAGSEFGLRGNDVGIVQGATRRLRSLTIGMQATVASRGIDDEMNAYFGAVFADEAQLFAANTFFPCVDGFAARYRIAVSADHRRKDKKEFLVEDLFGAVAKEIKRKTLVQSGDVLDVEIRVVPTDFDAPWYGMPADDDEDSSSSVQKKEINVDRLHKAMANDADRNRLIVDIVESEVKGHGSQVLVTVHQREHCMVLDQAVSSRGVRSGFLIGGPEYVAEFEKTDADLQARRTSVGIGTFKSIGYGIDMPAVGVGVAGTPIAANEQFFGQVRGRLCRTSRVTGKTDARLYYLWDRRVFGLKHLRNIVRWNTRVLVRRPSGEWVTGKDYLKQIRDAQRAVNHL